MALNGLGPIDEIICCITTSTVSTTPEAVTADARRKRRTGADKVSTRSKNSKERAGKATGHATGDNKLKAEGKAAHTVKLKHAGENIKDAVK